MQYVDRRNVPPPAHLLGSEARDYRKQVADLLQAEEGRRAQTDVPRSRLDLRDPSVVDALRRLFQGRCAFCEAETETQPHRFRPPSEAQPIESGGRGHLYYAWLAESWENIYPICKVCFPEDPAHFPVIGRRARLPTTEELEIYVANASWPEGPPTDHSLVLDPCRDKAFHAHLVVRADGWVLAASRRGVATIDYFNFNNPMRVEERRRAIASYLSALRDRMSVESWDALGVGPLQFARLAFGGDWYLFLRRVALELKRATHHPSSVSQSRISRFFQDFVRRPLALREFDEAVHAVAEAYQADAVRPQLAERKAAGGARLVSVRIENFKGVEALGFDIGPSGLRIAPEDDGPMPAMLILGENAAGKSSLLEAIALAMTDDPAIAQLDLASRSWLLNPAFMGDDESEPRTDGKVVLTFDDGKERTLTLGGRQRIALEGKTDLPPVFAYGAFRQYIDKTRNWSSGRAIGSLFKSDAVLSNPERWLLRLDEDRFSAVVRTLRHVLAIDRDFDVIERDPARNVCVVVTPTEGPDGAIRSRTPLRDVSSGFRSVLAMICDVLEGLMHPKVNPGFKTFSTARGVLLVDEIEAHLHPRWKMQIMRGLRTALPEMTIIATTHDPLCLRGMEDGEVMVLHRIAGEDSAKTALPLFVERLTGLPGVNRLTVEQLLTSDFFSLFSTDSPEAEADLARIADLLAARASGRALSDADSSALDRFEREVASALPIGSSEVQRLVQSAVADYLAAKRQASNAQRALLKHEARRSIVNALGQL